jgi:hypothetical protein
MIPAHAKKDEFDLAIEPAHHPPTLDPKELSGFAKWILLVITLLSVSVVTIYLHYPGSKEAANVYDLAKTILPPITTLILGFYFGFYFGGKK